MVHLTTKAIDKLQDIYPGVRVEVDHISAQLQDGNYEILCTTKEEWQKEYELEGKSLQNYRTTHKIRTTNEGTAEDGKSLKGSLRRITTFAQKQGSQNAFGREATTGSEF